ncbi:alcohol dehydrogenase catalytic domain-containing protein [Dactylosporangium sp. AC04546]|uniref:alcohol dehydrogenase catalytic domain-containing protein n=1 Tax=Dactylosporangium sp. AC04546 TaxID=2862460 RepID=UPI001EDCADF9|nr:alcohol dehydrogenase catalytic domain-containing protein [Dactylosporangium sp. AC04546]WVK78154.1 alcohol dehydrogenase catalytic domain-containing protein [Dactylosporangium sp. AC04546]
MFALFFERFGPPDVLRIGELPAPHAGAGEIRIRVMAAGVAPVDLALRSGRSRSTVALPHVPGVDAAGIVDEVGAGVGGVAVGDEVFGAVDVAKLGGATAEHAVLRFWAHRPAGLPWAAAGAAATSVETATRALDRLGVGPGAVLVVDGAAGGVGSVAVQLAVARGATVIGTARPESFAFVAGLGATPVAYGPGLADRIRNTGPWLVALDVAGKGSLPELIALTGAAERVLTLADFGGPALGVMISTGELGGEPDGRHGLAAAAALAVQGRFRVPVQAEYPLERAAEAHAAAERGPRRGKVAILLAARQRSLPNHGTTGYSSVGEH